MGVGGQGLVCRNRVLPSHNNIITVCRCREPTAAGKVGKARGALCAVHTRDVLCKTGQMYFVPYAFCKFILLW